MTLLLLLVFGVIVFSLAMCMTCTYFRCFDREWQYFWTAVGVAVASWGFVVLLTSDRFPMSARHAIYHYVPFLFLALCGWGIEFGLRRLMYRAWHKAQR
jgi:hypothetical protein